MNCKNCKTELTADSRYCRQCGARVVENRLTIRGLFHQFMESFFSYDNQFFKTIIDLLKRPTVVIDSFVNNVRKRYIDPLSFFAIALTFSGLYVFAIRHYFSDVFDMIYDDMYTTAAQKSMSTRINQITMEYNSLINFATIPLMAFLSWITFLNKRYNFTEHLVIYFYTISLYSMISSFVGLLSMAFFPSHFLLSTAIVLLLGFVYHCVFLKHLFKLSVVGIALRFLLFLVLLVVFYLVLVIIFSIIAIQTGVIDIGGFA